jgi:DNA-binding HxlR family transcriptional regulator
MTQSKDIRCSIARALGEVGERWSLLIIREAVMGSTRFDEFHERIGVARNILANRLAMLLEQGVMMRTQSAENARIHHYTLTPKGEALLPVLVALMQWGDQWLHAEVGAPILLVDSKSRKPIRKLNVAAHDGRPLTCADVTITAGPGATAIMRRRLRG